jgi:hypothetical protein
MKKTILTIFSSIIILYTYCQKNSDTISLKDLSIPTSPIFNLLGNSSIEVENKTTPKSFAISLVNAVGQSKGIPKNFAIELAPFWFLKSNGMTISKYYGISKGANLKKQENIFYGLKNTSFSIGSVNIDSSQNSQISTNYLAYSIKSSIISVRNKNVRKVLATQLLNVNRLLIDRLKVCDSTCLQNNNIIDSNFRKCINQCAIEKNEKLGKERLFLDSILSIRPFFKADLAFASSTGFANNLFNTRHHYRTGAWCTFSFSQPLLNKKEGNNISNLIDVKKYINIYGLVRYLKEENTADFKIFNMNKYFDYGARIEVEFDKISFSFETIYRNVKGVSNINTSRNVGIIQYKIADNLFFSGSFGKNFGIKDNLVALFGINWGFGNSSLVSKLSEK